jgi:hypothetical protein
MQSDDAEADTIDWSLTTWDGARREQLRRWSRMPLAEMILALEEMQVLAEKLSRSSP